MFGAYGKLACSLLLLSFVAVISTSCSEGSEGATTYVDGDWYINDTTTLSDGTWVVNGSVYVMDNKLTLDNAELIFNLTEGGIPRLHISQDAELEAYGSEIRDNGSGMLVEINGDTVLDNTTVANFYSWGVAGITHRGGELLLDHCRLENGNTLVESNGSIIVRSCELAAFDNYGLQIRHTYRTPGPNVVVKGTSITNNWEYSYYGIGFYIMSEGSPTQMGRFTVTDCYFNGLNYGIYVNQPGSVGYLTVQGNTAENCTYGVFLDRVDSTAIFSGNTWGAHSSGYAFIIYPDSSGWPDVNNETITGGNYGLYISGSWGPSTFRDIRITGVWAGVYLQDGTAYLYDSYVRSSSYDFYVGNGQLYLYGCDHTYNAYVTNYQGEVSEPVIINFTSVTWQEGTPIVEGYTTLENETGEMLSERNNKNPMEVMLATWKVTLWADITVEKVRGMYETDGTEFRSEPFTIDGVSRMVLVIIDNSTPEVSVRHPLAAAMFETTTLLINGNYTERGLGLGAIKVTHDGENWTKAEVFDERTWRIRMEDLPDGLLTFTVAINDKAGNSMQVQVPNITIDTVWPFIEVFRPDKYVSSTPIYLLAQTEPRARAYVNHREVDVMPDGMFTALLTLDKYENEAHIRVVDIVGHENWTIYKVYFDTTPPALIVGSPDDGHWASTGNITVRGTTESQVTVVVNGKTCQLEYGMFSIDVPLEYGLNQLVITSTDSAGNVATVYRMVHMDNVPPELTVMAPEPDSATDREWITVSGTAKDGNPVRVMVNNMTADQIDEDWIKEAYLVEGTNTLHIKAFDLAGNSASATLTVLCDLTAPTFTVELVMDAGSHSPSDSPLLTRSNSLTLKVVPSEESILRFSGGDDINLGTDTFTKEILLEPGPNEFGLYLKDLVGNRAESVFFVINLDNEPPRLRLLVDDDLIYVDKDAFLLWGETDPGCQVTIGGIPVQVLYNGSFAMNVHVDEGVNHVRVVSIDEAGNEASKTQQILYEAEEEKTGMSSLATILVAAICGLLAGLIAVLVVSKRSKVEPATVGGTLDDEEASSPPAVEPTLPPTIEPTGGLTEHQEVPGQLPPDPQREKDDWEML
jgi:hypothetical protein